jgi:hypothetical protein
MHAYAGPTHDYWAGWEIDFNLRMLFYVNDRFAGWRMTTCGLDLGQLFGRIDIGGVYAELCVSCLVENGTWDAL